MLSEEPFAMLLYYKMLFEESEYNLEFRFDALEKDSNWFNNKSTCSFK